MVEVMHKNQQLKGSASYDESIITKGISFADKAVDFEQEGKYEEAIKSQESAVNLFGEQIDLAPPDKKHVFEIFLKMYAQKLETLKIEHAERMEQQTQQSLAQLEGSATEQQKVAATMANTDVRISSSGDNTPQGNQDDFFIIEDPFEFLDMDLNYNENVPEAKMLLPEEQILRPFFFMRLIQKSIHEGSFITDQLFVPKYVWQQKNAQIVEIDKKLQFLNDLKKEMKTLGILKKNNQISKDFKQVENLISFVLKLQQEMRTIISQDSEAISARYSVLSSMDFDTMQYSGANNRGGGSNADYRLQQYQARQSGRQLSAGSGAGQMRNALQIGTQPSQNFAPHHQNTGSVVYQDTSKVADLRADDPNSQSLLFRITSHVRQITNKAMEKAGQVVFDLYGTYADSYGPEVDDLFSETYFLEQWIIELLTLQRSRTDTEEILLGKLSLVSKFFYECILAIVMSDMKVLLDCYLQQMSSRMTAQVTLGLQNPEGGEGNTPGQ